ncbi:MFS transporter [candidate division WOR-3 bacterium]|nr:MFS transporter [candidate division WOR-3 bacterium]
MSQLGDRLSHMLLITLIGLTTPGKLLAYSGGSLTFVLPTLILSPIAGVLVDHWDKRKTISRTHFLQTALLLLTPFAIRLTHSFTPFWIALTLFFGLDIFNNTANPALLPNLVSSDKLLLANSVNLAFARIATVLGMVIGGFLIKWVGWTNGIFIDASCHLIAGILILNIISPPHAETPSYRSTTTKPGILVLTLNALKQFISDLVELIRLVLHNRIVAFVLASIVISTFISAVSYTILIYIVQQVLHMGTSGVGIFAGILAVGMIAGAAAMGLLPQNINRPLIIVLITFLYGLLFFIGNWLITVWFMIIVALIAGIAFSWLGIVQSTMLQEEVEPAIRGRVFSTREFVANCTFLITTLTIGILGDFTSYRTAILVIGIALIVLGGAGFLWVRHGLRPGRRLNPDN